MKRTTLFRCCALAAALALWCVVMMGTAADAGNQDKDKKDKTPKKPKHECRDFAEPCQPEPYWTQMPPIPTTTTVSTSTDGVPNAVPKWFYLVNGSSSESEPLVLTDPSTTATNGAFLFIEPIQAGARGQLWLAEALGNGLAYLRSGLGNGMVLSYDGGCSPGALAVMYNSQQHAPLAGSDAFQQWNFSKAGSLTIGLEQVPLVTIGNPTCAGSLFVSGDKVLLGTDGGAPANQWYPWPNYPLDTILSEGAVPFPSGTGDQITAYNAIPSLLNPPLSIDPNVSCVLGGVTSKGIRCAYIDSEDWGSYPSQVASLANPDPDNISAASWQEVTAQLSIEFGYVYAVQTLFTNYSKAFTKLFLDNGISLNGYIGDALGTTDATNQLKGTTAAVLNGVLSTILSAGGPVAGVIGNLLETAINYANAKNQASEYNIAQQFQVAANDLYTQLSNSYTLVSNEIAVQATAILQDWGMLSQVGQLALATGPGSLEWTTESSDDFQNRGAAGYSVSAMQMLLPARYQLYRLTAQADGNLIDSNTNDGTFTNFCSSPPPDYAQYAQFLGTQEGAPSEYSLWNKYYIADGNCGYPDSQALQTDVWDKGGSAHDFFLATNGWEGFITNDQYLNCEGLNVTITNFTGNSLSVVSSQVSGAGLQGGNRLSLYQPYPNIQGGFSGTWEDVELPLPPYGSVSFGSAYNDGLEFNYAVWDGNYSSTASVVSFNTHQHSCSGSNDTWLDGPFFAVGSNYRYAEGTIVTQSGSNPGGVSVGVYLAE